MGWTPTTMVKPAIASAETREGSANAVEARGLRTAQEELAFKFWGWGLPCLAVLAFGLLSYASRRSPIGPWEEWHRGRGA